MNLNYFLKNQKMLELNRKGLQDFHSWQQYFKYNSRRDIW